MINSENLISCNFCNKKFKSISNLNYHKKSAKYCLVIQGKIDKKEKNFVCVLCNKILSTKQILENHKKICKKNIEEENVIIRKELEETKIKNLENQFKIKYKEFKKQENIYKEQINKQNEQIKELQDKLERMGIKAIEKPTITNNTVNKFELHTFPTQEEIDNKIGCNFNDKYILEGWKGIAQFVFDHIVKLEDGRIAYGCYDISRQIFKYKDSSGNEIKDSKALKLKK